jgi:hypothetical protein
MNRTLNPYLILAAAILLPGAGQVLTGRQTRGLVMQLFMVSLAMITWHLSTPQISIVGRLSGGIFVYALSIPDAYRSARLNWVRARSPSLA